MTFGDDRKANGDDGSSAAVAVPRSGTTALTDGPFRRPPEKLGSLRQLYGEARYLAECERQGTTVESRSVDKDGNVVLMCSMK
jgi:hypothetical protein